MERNEGIASLHAELFERLPSSFVTRAFRVPEIPGKIDVFVGMRRTGKTYLVYQRMRELLARGVEASAILYLNLEDDRLLPLDRAGLTDLLDAFYAVYPQNHDRLCHVFLDEVQNTEGWPAVVRRFLDTKRVHLSLTGSSAKLLSREIATSLRGRSIATEVWPFSYLEFRLATNAEAPSSSPRGRDVEAGRLRDYLKIGGLPEVVSLNDLDRKRVLQDYVSVVVLRDLIERHRIKNEALLRYFVKTLLSQIARPLSINKLANDLKSQGRKTGKNTLYQYLEHIRDCSLAFDVPIFSESVKKQQSNPRKIYAADTGLARAQSFGLSENTGRLFENLVFLDLKRAQYDVAYYVTREGKEVDFVASQADGRARLIQVCTSLDDAETRLREESALNAAKRELGLPGEIVTLDNYAAFVAALG